MIDIGIKFYSAPIPFPGHELQVKVVDFNFMLKFNIKSFTQYQPHLSHWPLRSRSQIESL